MADARVSPLARGVPRHLTVLAVGLATAFGFCCSAASSPRALPVSAPAPAAPNSSFGTGLRTIEAMGQGLAFPLPDASGWRLDRRETHSWVARHVQSSSELLVRAWHFDGIARPQDCEREARLWRKELPRFAPDEVISANERLLAGVYRGSVTVGVRTNPTPEHLLGSVLAFGSDARDCLMLAYSTSAAGPEARRLIAERLAVIAGSVFERAHRLPIEGRVDLHRF